MNVDGSTGKQIFDKFSVPFRSRQSKKRLNALSFPISL